MKSILKYPGAKWSIAPWVISHLPEHHSYLEPFFGSGAVFFNKPKSRIETVNDLDGDVVNLFECIRRDPEKLAWELEATPYSRQEYEMAYQDIPEDSIQRARRFFILCNMGHGFRVNGEKVGWKNDVQGREYAYAVKSWNRLPEQVFEVAARLKEAQIDNRPACDLIRRFNHPNVLIYADPPYLLSTRHGKQYKCEMSDADHEELLETLKLHTGPVLISGYESDLYNTLLKGWRREQKTAYSQVMSKKTEVLWMNF